MSQRPMTLQTHLADKSFAWRRWLLILIVATLLSGGFWWAKETGQLDRWLGSTTANRALNTSTTSGAVAEPPIATPLSATDIATAAQSAAVANETATPVETTAATTKPTADTRAVEAVTAPRSLVAVAGIDGVQLWDAEGQVITTLEIGAKLQATARTADGQWLTVEAAHGNGWAQAAQVIAFDLDELPVTNLTAPTITANNQPAATNLSAVNATTTESASPVVTTETPAPDPSTDSEPAAAVTADQALTALVVTSGANLNVRAGPSTSAALVTKIANGATVTLVGRDESSAWLQIQLSTTSANTGWVAAQYLQLASALDTFPVVATTSK